MHMKSFSYTACSSFYNMLSLFFCRRLSGAVWPTARRTGSMFTNCARTPTSSLTWDVQTPPAPCSPPPHLCLPTDWLSHMTDRTLWPISRQDCWNWRIMDVDLFFFFFCLLELFPNGYVGTRGELNWERWDGKRVKTWKGDTPFAYVVQRCALELSCVRYGKWTKFENRERERANCLEQEMKMMKLVHFFMDFIK